MSPGDFLERQILRPQPHTCRIRNSEKGVQQAWVFSSLPGGADAHSGLGPLSYPTWGIRFLLLMKLCGV